MTAAAAATSRAVVRIKTASIRRLEHHLRTQIELGCERQPDPQMRCITGPSGEDRWERRCHEWVYIAGHYELRQRWVDVRATAYAANSWKRQEDTKERRHGW